MIEGVEAFPLCWPEGWPQTEYRKWSLPGGRTSNTWHSVLGRLQTELKRLGAENMVLSTNQPLRRDGQPYANRTRVDEPGVAVYFEYKGKNMVMAQDAFEMLVDNIRSLALAIEGLRQMERHGGAAMMERAFSGFEALPNPDKIIWHHVLGVPENASEAEIRRAYHRAAKNAHPDKGGDTARMAQVNEAWEQVRELGLVK